MIRAILSVAMIALAGMASGETKVPVTQVEISLGFAPLVKQAAPAVVNIYASQVVESRESPLKSDRVFEEFFRGFGSTRPKVQNSLGSGVILSADGIVVSNYHVVGMATDIRIVTNDRHEYSAQVLLGDKESDLAILKLEGAEGLPHLSLRNSDQVEVGELVLAIGNPFGVGQTVSSGIVSGLARSGTATGNARGYFIQTDAPINPGNSGGALIDVNGALIGINTSILSRSGGSNGIGFAIPANLVAEFVAQARVGGDQFQRPWAGMAGQPVDADLAASLGLDRPEGIVVSDLHRDSPFAIAGIAVGDVITHVDGQEVNSPSEMLFRMSVTGIGGVSRITRVHGATSEDVEVAMMAAPAVPAGEEMTLDDDTALPGLKVTRINPAVIARHGLPLTLTGVLVLDTGRLGARAGLKAGDVLLQINDDEMARSRDVSQALTDPGRRVRMELQRRGQRMSLRFRL
jgi:Do/DeqQ family serine protease